MKNEFQIQFFRLKLNSLNIYMKFRYHNRENLVISALLAEGYSRSYHLQPDESLFYKLKSYFPTVEPETIRQMIIK
jgi:hypothetical protein